VACKFKKVLLNIVLKSASGARDHCLVLQRLIKKPHPVYLKGPCLQSVARYSGDVCCVACSRHASAAPAGLWWGGMP